MSRQRITEVKVNTTPALPCHHCNRTFPSKTRLEHHLKYFMSNRAFGCPVKDCGRIFNAKSHVTEHMNLHYGNRPHACTFPGCAYRGKTSSQLAQHRATHGLGYVYACDYCDYQATTSSNLRRHARLHMDTRPYRCPHCPHTFVELSALRRHVLDSAYHPGLPLYVCPWCRGNASARPSTSSLIIDSPVKWSSRAPHPPADGGVCGFNSSNLAWRHVVEAHADQLANPETLERLGRKPGEVLIEHDVSLIFGLYHPSQDGNFRPSSAVRQLNSVPTPRTHQRMRSGKNRRKQQQHNPPNRGDQSVPGASTVTLLTVSSLHPLMQPNPNSNAVDTSQFDNGAQEESLQFAQQDGVVALPGGALWSASLFQSELIRMTNGQGPPT